MAAHSTTGSDGKQSGTPDSSETPSLLDGAEAELKEAKPAPLPARAPPKKRTKAPPKGRAAEEEKDPDSFVEEAALFAIKTSIGHEKMAADVIALRAKQRGETIYGILCPTNLRGYIFVEATNEERLRHLVKGIRKVRGVVEGKMAYEEIHHFLTPKPAVAGIAEGDIVEIVTGPFKGEKGRVKSIDRAREEITLELIEAMIPIPITVRGDHVRVIEKEEREREEKEAAEKREVQGGRGGRR